ncbi:PAS domain S-box protein [bacterium]|nr:MAG: PAS domain S-box protein [bacterium]
MIGIGPVFVCQSWGIADDFVEAKALPTGLGMDALVAENPQTELAQMRREMVETRAELEQARRELERARTNGHRVSDLLERERAHFHSVFEGIGEGLLLTDLEDRVLYANERMLSMSGYSREDVLGRPAYELLLPPEEWPQLHGRNERRAKGEVDVYETRLHRKNGTRFWTLIHATPLRDSAGNVVGTIGALLDITTRKNAEMAQKQSEERLRGVIEHAVDGLIIHDFNGNVLEANAQICNSLGYSRDELLAMNVRDIELHFHDAEVLQKWQDVKEGARITVNGRHKRSDGSSFPVEARVGLIEWEGINAILAVVRDISERERREEMRRALEARFESVVGAASDAVVLADAEGKVMLWNARAHSIFGWSEEESLERDITFIMPPRYRHGHHEGLERVSKGGDFKLAGQVLSLVGLHKDGHEFPIELTLGLWRDGEHTFYTAIIRDVSERERLARELRDALIERRLIMDAVPDVLFRLDMEGRLVAWNKELERVTGWDAEVLTNRPAIEFFEPQYHGLIIDAIVRSLRGEQVEVEAPLLHANGSTTPHSLAAVPLRDDAGTLLGLVGTARDITEKLKAEEQIRLSLREKEVLLKEIHHRVKNNLQIINSLLSMQADALGDARVKAAFAESQNRVRAMALIHETLYRAGDLGRIDVRAYCNRLTSALVRGYSSACPGVSLQLDVPNGLFLPLDAAVPCGLIINELVTNSLKYAFRGRQTGLISIAIEIEGEDHWTLRVGDDGVGMPCTDVATVTSTGLQLVTGLCDQLESDYRVSNDGGTQWTIPFTTA